MFIPKPVLFILFFLAIGSTAGLLYLLSQRSPVALSTPKATNTVIVSPSSVASNKPEPSATSSPAAQLSASAEWKTATSSALSFKVDYPADWKLSNESDALTITAPSSSVVVSIKREKKQSSSSKLASYVSSRGDSYKKDEYTVKDEASTSVDDYSGNDRLYIKESSTVREIVFTTRNYFYIISVTPGQGDISPVVNDIIKSIRIQ